MKKIIVILFPIFPEKGIFSNTYKIYSEGKLIGKLKSETFTQSTEGELNGRKYIFKSKGFFKQHTEILDCRDNVVIGKITYNGWMTKANSKIGNERASWKYDNIWNTKWSISNSEGVKINYRGTSTNGKIESNTDDDLLHLSGLFVTNYYTQMTIVVMIIIFIPLIMKM